MKEIIVPGELTRAALALLCKEHLVPVFEKLQKMGVAVSAVIAPFKDPADGKAVVLSNVHDANAILTMLALASVKIAREEGVLPTEGDT